MLNFKPVRIEQNNREVFGISIEWSDLSQSPHYHDGLTKWEYTTDIDFVVHELYGESEYYKVLNKILNMFIVQITEVNSAVTHPTELANRISGWLSGEGYRQV